MKKVLITTYYFPPRPAVGSLRPSGLAKYLPEFGWEASILTPRLSDRRATGFDLVQTEHGDRLAFLKGFLGLDSEQSLMTQVAQLKKKLRIRAEKSVLDFLLVRWAEITAYPDPQKGWRAHAVQVGGDFLSRSHVDAILSTSSPPTSHIVASQLKRKHEIPWVADFRDLWTQNHFYPYSSLRKSIETRLERKTLSEADALVTVCQPAAENLERLHKGKPVHVIPNGFDPDETNEPESDLTSKFTITYTGIVYPGKQSAEPLFAALADLIAQGVMNAGDVEVRFYGPEAGWIDMQARHHGLTNQVRQFGIVPREIALSKQRESQLLLFMKWNDPEERGYYSAKIFEYLAARRPILAIGGYEDVASELLRDTRAGKESPGPEELRETLRTHYREFQEAGRVNYEGDESRIMEYSQRHMARRFAGLLDSLQR